MSKESSRDREAWPWLVGFGLGGAVALVSNLQWISSWVLGHVGVVFLGLTAARRLGISIPRELGTVGSVALLVVIVTVAVTKWLPTWRERIG